MRGPDRLTKEVRKRLELLKITFAFSMEDTIVGLGEKDAFHIENFHRRNQTDIANWITPKYRKESKNSVTSLHLFMLFKELPGMQYLFLSANYPAVYRNLRHLWESFSKSYVVDKEHPTYDRDKRVDEMFGLEERRIFGWGLIERVCKDVLNKSKQEVQKEFYPLWDHLNRHVHPSVETFLEVSSVAPKNLWFYSFNEQLARECLRRVDQVMDLVFAAVFRIFPRITELALNYPFLDEWARWIPHTHKIVQTNFPTP